MKFDLECFLSIALEKKFDLLDHLLAEDVEFHNPAGFTPVTGKAHVKEKLVEALSAIQPMQYHRIWDNGREHACEFSGEVGGKKLKGIDLITLNDQGKIARLEVMLRPISALMAMREAHGAGHSRA